MLKNKSGFTIVELLIVIVVIAILAAITIVAYNGISNRAHDTAVQQDLSTLSKKLEIYKIDHGFYPYQVTSVTDFGDSLREVDMKLSLDSYSRTKPSDGQVSSNIAYFEFQNGAQYGMIARSKSNKMFFTSSSNSTVTEYTGSYVSNFPSVSFTTLAGQIGITGVPAGGADLESFLVFTNGNFRIWT